MGFLVPFAAAAGIGIMTVAFVTVHRRNGFFIFREGEGYEYVMTVAFALTALAVLGGGQASLDHALDLDLDGITIGLGAAAAGIVGAAGMLVASWRPSGALTESRKSTSRAAIGGFSSRVCAGWPVFGVAVDG